MRASRKTSVQAGPWNPQDEQLVASATSNAPQQRARKPRFSDHGTVLLGATLEALVVLAEADGQPVCRYKQLANGMFNGACSNIAQAPATCLEQPETCRSRSRM